MTLNELDADPRELPVTTRRRGVGTHRAALVGSDLVREADRVTGHNVRVEDGLWALFGRRSKVAGYPSRTAAIVAFMRWYCRVPGARLPQRPGEEAE